MKIKNTSSKIINFGGTFVLPNEISEISNDFAKNDVLAAYEELDIIAILKDEPKTEEVKKNKDSIPENYKLLKKAELIELCEKHKIEISDEDTKTIIVEKIREYLG